MIKTKKTKKAVIFTSFILMLTVLFSMTALANTLSPGYSDGGDIVGAPGDAGVPLGNTNIGGGDAGVPLGNVTIDDVVGAPDDAGVPLVDIKIGDVGSDGPDGPGSHITPTPETPRTNPFTGDNVILFVILAGVSSFIFFVKRKSDASA